MDHHNNNHHNHHFRSRSELITSNSLNSTINNNGASRADASNPLLSSNQLSIREPTCPNVIEHSDSQLSLDRLFNPPNTTSTVPLRNRNLPPSFFNPTWQTAKSEALNENATTNMPAMNSANRIQETSLPPVQQPLPPQRANAHFKTFSSPVFMSNINSSNAYTHGANSNNQAVSIGSVKQEQTHGPLYYSDLESNMTPERANTYGAPQPLTNQPYQPAQPLAQPPTRIDGDYYSSGSTNDLSNVNQPVSHCIPQTQEVTTLNSYFTGNDSHHQQFHITHSQPYMPYHSSLSSSSGIMNPSSSQTASSSSSNENNSLLCIPTPGVHSRSCSFDERSHHPVAHARSQSNIVGVDASRNFDNGFGGRSNNYSGQMGFAEPEQSQSIGGPYNQVTLSPITDQTNVFEDWNEISM